MAERFLASLCLVLVAMAQAGAPLAGGPQVAAFGELEAVKPANAGMLVALEVLAGRVAYDRQDPEQRGRLKAAKWRVTNMEPTKCWRVCDLRLYADPSCTIEARGWVSTMESGHFENEDRENALRADGTVCGVDGGNFTIHGETKVWSPTECADTTPQLAAQAAWIGVEYPNATEIRCVKMAQHPHDDAQVGTAEVQYFEEDSQSWKAGWTGSKLRNTGNYSRLAKDPAAPVNAAAPSPCNETLEKTLQGTIGCPDAVTHRYKNESSQLVHDSAKKRMDEGKGVDPAAGESEDATAQRLGKYFYKTDPDEIKEMIAKVGAADEEVEKELTPKVNTTQPFVPRVHAACPTHKRVKPYLHFPPSNKSSEDMAMALIRTVAGCGGNVTLVQAGKIANRTAKVLELVEIVGGHNHSNGELPSEGQARVKVLSASLSKPGSDENGTKNGTTVIATTGTNGSTDAAQSASLPKDVAKLIELLAFRPPINTLRTILDALSSNKNETGAKASHLSTVMREVMAKHAKTDRKQFELSLHKHVDRFYNKTAKLHVNDTTPEERARETKAKKSAHKLIRDMRSGSKANKTSVVKTALQRWANSPSMQHNASGKASLLTALQGFVDRRNGTRKIGSGPSMLTNLANLEGVLHRAMEGLQEDTNTSLDQVSGDLKAMLKIEKARFAAGAKVREAEEKAAKEKAAKEAKKAAANATGAVAPGGGVNTTKKVAAAAGNKTVIATKTNESNATNASKSENKSDVATDDEAAFVKTMQPSELVSTIATNVNENKSTLVTAPGVKAIAVNRLASHLIDMAGPEDNQTGALKDLLNMANNRSFDMASADGLVDSISKTGNNGEVAEEHNETSDVIVVHTNDTAGAEGNETVDDDDGGVNGTNGSGNGSDSNVSGSRGRSRGGRGGNSSSNGSNSSNGSTVVKTKKTKKEEEEDASGGALFHKSYAKRNALMPMSLALNMSADGISLDNFNDIEPPVPEFPHSDNQTNRIVIMESITNTTAAAFLRAMASAQANGKPIMGTNTILLVQTKAKECPNNDTRQCGIINTNCEQCLKLISKLEADGKRVVDTKGTAAHTLAKLDKEGVTGDQIMRLIDVLDRSPASNFDPAQLAAAPDFEHELGEILYPAPLLAPVKSLSEREQQVIQNLTGGSIKVIPTSGKNTSMAGGNGSEDSMEQPALPRCSQRTTCGACNVDRLCGWCETTKRVYEFSFWTQAINEVPVTTGECMRVDPETEKPATKKCEGIQSLWKPEYCMRANCSSGKTCGDCNQDRRCGWCNSVDPAKRGCFNAVPWGGYERVKDSWKRKLEMGLEKGGASQCTKSDWNYGTCINANCTARAGCNSCVKDVRCGFCLTTCMRLEEASNADICQKKDFEWNTCPTHGKLDNWRNQDWHPMNSLSYAEKNKNAFNQFKPSFICSALTEEGPRNCVNNTLCGWGAGSGATGTCMAGDKDGPDSGSADRWFYGETPDDFCGRFKSNCSSCLSDGLCNFCISGPSNTGACLSQGNNDGSGPDACLAWRHADSTEPEDVNETCTRPLPMPPVMNVTVNTTANFTRRRNATVNATVNVTVPVNVTIPTANVTNATKNVTVPVRKLKTVYHKQHPETKAVTYDDLLVSDRPHSKPGDLKHVNASKPKNSTLIPVSVPGISRR